MFCRGFVGKSTLLQYLPQTCEFEQLLYISGGR